MKLKSSRMFLSGIIFILLNSALAADCLAQYSSSTNITFQESEAVVSFWHTEGSATDSVQLIRLSVSVTNKMTGYFADSVWFALKGAENLKKVRSGVRTRDRTSYSLEYVFKKVPEPFPTLTLEIYSRQDLLGKIGLQAGSYFVRLVPVHPGDKLSYYRAPPKVPCSLNHVKQLVAPKLPDPRDQPYVFKRQVK